MFRRNAIIILINQQNLRKFIMEKMQKIKMKTFFMKYFLNIL